MLLLFQKDLAMLGDLGRHLKLGEIVTKCFCVPQTNLFSYTHPNFPIVNHEWLAEVVFYLVSVSAGLSGLLIFKMVLIITAATLIYITALRKGSLFWVIVLAFPFVTLFSMRFFVLPELFSYLFISSFIFLIERYKQTRKLVFLYPLPILELLWVNMHIYFIIGIVVYGFFLLEEIIKKKKINKLLLLNGLLMILAIFINPSFVQGAMLPFTFSKNYGFNVEENNSPFSIFSPSSTNGNVAYTLVLQVLTFELLIGVFIITLFIKRHWRQIFHTGNGLTGAFLGIKYTRCISLFGLLGFISIVRAFTYMEDKLKKSLDDSMRNIIKGFVVLGVIIIVAIHIKGLIDYRILSFGFVPSAENAVNFLKENNVQGNIYNNYVIGNYLIYGLYPQKRVFVDARPEAYPASFFNDYWRMMSDENFFENQVKKYNINIVLFNVFYDDPVRIRPLLTRLIQGKEWVPVFADGTVTIFVRDIPVNKTIIEKYKIGI